MKAPMIIVVVLNMRGLSASEKLTFANRIMRSMTANPNFATPTPTLLILQAVIADLDLAITNWRKGAPLLTSQLQDAVAELIRTLKFMAAYVEYESHNDATKALSSGFTIKSESSHPATGFSGKNGNLSGSADLKTDAVRGAAFLWQQSKDPFSADSWTGDKITNHGKYTYTDCVPLTKMWFRVALIIDDVEQEFSDPISINIV